jgi:hypothetical protein
MGCNVHDIENKVVVINRSSFFLNAWDMKGCEEGGMMMMFIRMGVVL